MVDVLVIPDGAAQPVRGRCPTAFESARMPVLDRLVSEGELLRVATTPPGCGPGSETGIPGLLGAPQARTPGRGWVDAAAYGVELPDGMIPWRVDVLDAHGGRASAGQAREAARLIPGAIALRGHRLVVLSPTRPALSGRLRVWDGGEPPSGAVSLTLICAAGAGAGCGRLLGAKVIVPVGATGDVDSDLRAKADAALRCDAGRVVVHVGAPDEAAHRHDLAAVVKALQRIDRELLAPLAHAGRRLTVCPDHATDPQSGRHDDAPVPAVRPGPPDDATCFSERAASTRDPITPDELLSTTAAA